MNEYMVMTVAVLTYIGIYFSAVGVNSMMLDKDKYEFILQPNNLGFLVTLVTLLCITQVHLAIIYTIGIHLVVDILSIKNNQINNN
jgi:hypothetical protein